VNVVTLLQQLINGFSLGSLYALIAMGYTMVYGILRLINFAHGDLLMVAAYVGVMRVALTGLMIMPEIINLLGLSTLIGD
jgi:branched-chain amino acid transport system permease protein